MEKMINLPPHEDLKPKLVETYEFKEPSKVETVKSGNFEYLRTNGESEAERVKRLLSLQKNDFLGTREIELRYLFVRELSRIGYTENSEAGIAFLNSQNVKDEVEAMLCAQMYAAHVYSMRYSALADKQATDQTKALYANIAVKYMRTYTTQMEALSKYRGKGQQRITVEHVTVNDGGKAAFINTLGQRGREGV